MPEEKNTAGAGNGGGEGGNADDQNQNGAGENGDQNTNDGSGDGDGKNKDGDDDGSSNDDGDDKGDDKGSQNKDDDGDDEPAVRKRKSAKDYIIERQARKIEKLKGSKNDDDGGSGDDDGDGEIDQEDEKIINKVVDKRLAPIFKQQAEAEDEQEVQQFIKDNPDFKPYADKVRRDMKHPSRSQVRITSYNVCYTKLLRFVSMEIGRICLIISKCSLGSVIVIGSFRIDPE